MAEPDRLRDVCSVPGQLVLARMWASLVTDHADQTHEQCHRLGELLLESRTAESAAEREVGRALWARLGDAGLTRAGHLELLSVADCDGFLTCLAEVASPTSEGLASSLTHVLMRLRQVLQAGDQLARALDRLRELHERLAGEPTPGAIDVLHDVVAAGSDPEQVLRALDDSAVECWRKLKDQAYRTLQARRALLPVEAVKAVLVVENDRAWQERIKAEVLDPVRQRYNLSEDRTPILATAADAREWLAARGEPFRGHLLSICDLHIPDRTDGPPSIDHGERLAEELRRELWGPVVVVTTHGSRFDAIARLGWLADDFIEKGGPMGLEDEWAELLQEQLAIHLEPLRLAQSELHVLGYTGTSVVFNGVEVALSPMEYALLESLAVGQESDTLPCLWQTRTMGLLQTLASGANEVDLGVVSEPAIQEVLQSELLPDDLDIAARAECVIRFLGGSESLPQVAHQPLNWRQLRSRFLLEHSDIVEQVWEDEGTTQARVADSVSKIKRKLQDGLQAARRPIPVDLSSLVTRAAAHDPSSRPAASLFHLNTEPRSTSVWRHPEEHTAHRAGRREGSYRILLVEDQPVYRQLAAEKLSDTLGGAQVVSVGTVDEAAQQLKTGPFDLLILDLELSGTDHAGQLDGVQIFRAAASSGSVPETIIFSVHDRPEVRAKLRRRRRQRRVESQTNPRLGGPRDYVVKCGLVEQDVGAVVASALRAWVDHRRGYRSVDVRGLHHVQVPAVPFGRPDRRRARQLLVDTGGLPSDWFVNGRPLSLLDTRGRATASNEILAGWLLATLAGTPNEVIHRRQLIVRLFECGALAGQTDYAEALKLAAACITRGLKEVGLGEMGIWRTSANGTAYGLFGQVRLVVDEGRPLR